MNDNVVTLVDKDGEDRRADLKLTPQAEDLSNLASRLKDEGQFATALVALRRAILMCPESGHLWNGLGSVLWNIGRYEEAHEALVRAMQLLGQNATVLMNMGMVLSSLRRVQDSLQFLKRTVELMPNNFHAEWSYSLGLMDHGFWEEGFKHYESRIGFRGVKYYPKLKYPMWNGEDLAGKTLFVQAEQGVGDRILFSRYLAWVAEKWPTAKIKCLMSSADQIALEGLLWGFVERYPQIEFLHHGIPWPEADYGCFLLSLARIHGTTPDNVYPDPGIIRERAVREKDIVEIPEPLVPAIKVGISWTGNPIMLRNSERSIPVEMMLELECDPLVQLYSLQFGDDGLRRQNATQLVCDLTQDIGGRGLLGTAVTMLNLDLIITCCTANAHLAGALGVPVWTLLCYDPYWCWLRGRDDTPWYPNMRLFRQRAPGDWRELIDRVRRELNIHARLTLEQRGKEERSHG